MEEPSRMKQRRTELGLTLQDIADQLQLARSTVQRYETGSIRTVKMPVVEGIARVLQVNPDWLLGKSEQMLLPVGEPYHPRGRMPILGRVAAGLPLYAESNIEGYAANDFADGCDYFCLRIHGDSMTAAGMNDGDLLVVRSQEDVDDGEIAVVLVDDNDATVKRVRRQGDLVTLLPQSFNPAHQIQIYNLKDTSVRIVGRVMEVRKRY